jgi:hypothetical protein
VSAPAISTPSTGISEQLERAASIQRSVEAIESQFPPDQRGSLEIDPETGAVTFTYIGVGGSSIMTGICVNGRCGSAAGGSVSCFENQVPNLSTGSCQCASGFRPSRMDGSGGCVSACPPGTSLVDLSANRPLFMCGCNNNPDVVMGFDGNPTACQADNTAEMCRRYINPITDEISPDAPPECDPEALRQAEIERQRLLNEAEAQRQAAALADSDLTEQINQARSGATSSCQSQTQSFINQCRTVAAQAPPNETINSRDAGSVNQCRSLQRSSESVISQVESQVEGCLSQYESLRGSCPETTDEFSVTREVTVGEGAVQGTGSGSASGSDDIPENSQMLGQASSVFSDLTRLSTQVSSEMRELERQAQECIAAFEQDPDNSRGNNFAGLAQTAAQAFGNLNKSGSSGGPGELGAGGSLSGAAQAPGFQGSNSYGGDSSSYSSADGPTGFNGGGSDFDTKLGDPSNPQGRNTASGGPAQGNPGMGGMAMPMGGAAGRAGSGNSQAQGNDKQNKRRNFTKAEDRNLVLGYKKVKKDGQDLTYKPEDLEKIGRTAMLKKLEEAKKKFGDDTPLLFQNGEFVRDYLEMKNRLAWQRHNLKQKNRLSGIFNSSKEQEAKAFHQCALFGECYTESRYNIFKLHHYKAIKFIEDKE